MRITVKQLRQIIREELARETAWKKDGVMSEKDRMHDEEENEAMYESQRGNDENGQHDNDTDPSDPYARHLRESIRRLLRRR